MNVRRVGSEASHYRGGRWRIAQDVPPVSKNYCFNWGPQLTPSGTFYSPETGGMPPWAGSIQYVVSCIVEGVSEIVRKPAVTVLHTTGNDADPALR